MQLVNEVKAFVRFENEDAPLQRLSLPELLHELLEFLQFDGSFPSERLSLELEDEPFVLANRVKLQQVLINLLKNAAHAIRDLAEGRIVLKAAIEDQTVLMTVSDNGCGMTSEVAARIWEPFFSTKGEEGTGLGLDVVKGIIESYHGRIECRTAPGAGATFSIRLPLANAENIEAANAARAACVNKSDDETPRVTVPATESASGSG